MLRASNVRRRPNSNSNVCNKKMKFDEEYFEYLFFCDKNNAFDLSYRLNATILRSRAA